MNKSLYEYNNKEVNALKKLPERTCIGCNQTKQKKELIRIVKNKEGNIFVDKTGRANGRGAYICDNTECLEKAIKSKRLERNFETKINNEIYLELKNTMSNE